MLLISKIIFHVKHLLTIIRLISIVDYRLDMRSEIQTVITLMMNILSILFLTIMLFLLVKKHIDLMMLVLTLNH
nr:MAG TPA: hypothetical protein [Caudoviricetes sp.]